MVTRNSYSCWEIILHIYGRIKFHGRDNTRKEFTEPDKYLNEYDGQHEIRVEKCYYSFIVYNKFYPQTARRTKQFDGSSNCTFLIIYHIVRRWQRVIFICLLKS